MNLFQQQYGDGEPAIIILHGILGSARNWHSAAKILAEKKRIIVPDLRNHGRSPHTEVHEINALVDDILELQQKTDAAPGVIMGHSMGGLIACEAAFRSRETVRALIVIDVAPREHRGNVVSILDTMKKVELHKCENKSDVDSRLALTIADPLIRQFVLTNLVQDDGFHWRINLPALYAYLLALRTYRPADTDFYDGPTLFLRGERSDYITDSDSEVILQHFPQAQIITVPEAGHWIHYDNLPVLVDEVQRFLQSIE